MEGCREPRFRFGKNWRRFLDVLDPSRVQDAQLSLIEMLSLPDLSGKTFLDIGSGSGLFSLAARRLGARVHSFDFDPDSVACTLELKERFFPSDSRWAVEQGSVLDGDYLRRLGRFDIVYAWGVLHHTGNLWQAIENAAGAVGEGGFLFIALYNDQGARSRVWRAVKRCYVSGLAGRIGTVSVFVPYFVLRGLCTDLLSLQNPARRYREYRRSRGMHIWTDWLDWLGGYPFEVASVDDVSGFFRSRQFDLVRLHTCNGGSGNNEFLFRAPEEP